MTTTTDAAAPRASRLLALEYGRAARFYDLTVRWGLLPVGGERRYRRALAEWLRPAPGQRVASLCCGTGSNERALLEREPRLSLVGLDRGRAQLARARRRLRGTAALLVRGDAARTGLASASCERVLIGMALHEMPRAERRDVLREARRVCAPEGRVLVVEFGRPERRSSRLARSLWWFLWVPGNPEAATARDLEERGLAEELRAAGLEPVERHATRPAWIEALLARPA